MVHRRYLEDHCRSKKNMYKTISKECNLSELKSAIDTAGLKEAIETLDPITVFGPTNKAFKKFVPGPTCGELNEILLYHVVPEYLKACKLENDKLYDTLRDGTLPGSKMKVRANVYSCPKFNNVITINGSRVVEANIKAKNGVLHKINKVLCPSNETLLNLAVNTPDLSILVAAVEAADVSVAEALNNTELSLTLFAPTNQAFEDLALELGLTLQELLDFLLAPENKQLLTDILLYHVFNLKLGTVFSPAFKCGKTCGFKTLLKCKKLGVKRKTNIKIIDELCRYSKVVSADNLATNGVAHVIDKVLLPFKL